MALTPAGTAKSPVRVSYPNDSYTLIGRNYILTFLRITNI
jgi:hypothetical protein